MYDYFNEIFLFLYNRDNNVVIMAAFIALHGLIIVLRLGLFLSYRGHNMWLAMDMAPSRALEKKADVVKIKSSLLRKIVVDYMQAAEKNAPRVPLDAIVDKHVLDLSFLGLSFAGISRWIDKFDNGLLLLGVALAFIFPDYGTIYGLLAVSGFVTLKIAGALFDFETARQVLKNNVHLYVEREAGQFFASHMASAIARFKEEMSEAADRQSLLLSGAVEKLGADLIPVLNNLQCLSGLPKALEIMLQSNDRYSIHHEAFLAQAKIIQDTQYALEASLASYETTLQNLVQNMGGGMGAFIQLHGQNAAANLNEVMQTHMNHIMENNRQTVSAITNLLEQLTDQMRALNERITEL